ncbi:hypothetical protein EOI86_22240 [Hwanghaeella grinnelliae]|uniref:Phytanoyl-CoA dioxygenase n=1 Tax=Hwanghaeella grinnelliae TaxID=2500179 RepID=A0A3S2Y050_9PROT|nr:phytanoyl-CoA dioxygenase family protein [Hwanghaeella grinnelliae]RVU33856.1 hypothetical protein EOI86_22240 [Hwanghaeella grinnelliae]
MNWYHGFQAYVESREELRPFADLIMPSAADADDAAALRMIHARTAPHTLYSIEAETAVLGAINGYVRDVLGIPNPVREVPDQALAPLAALRQVGYSMLPDIAPNIVTAMRDYFMDRPVYEHASTMSKPPLTLDEAQGSFNLAHFREADILNCPHLMQIATDPIRLGIAQEYLGTVPQVITIAAWWSFAQADEARAAQLFHLDLDDYRFFKFFIYLTDVDEEAGPHVYVPGTHRQDTLVLARRAANDPELFDNWMGTLRKSDQDVMNVFGIDPVRIVGPAGTNFVASTRGIHKGLLPKSKNRLICQVAYGVTPQRVENHLPVELSPETTPNLPADFLTPPMDYVMQLYLCPPGGP